MATKEQNAQFLEYLKGQWKTKETATKADAQAFMSTTTTTTPAPVATPTPKTAWQIAYDKMVSASKYNAWVNTSTGATTGGMASPAVEQKTASQKAYDEYRAKNPLPTPTISTDIDTPIISDTNRGTEKNIIKSATENLTAQNDADKIRAEQIKKEREENKAIADEKIRMEEDLAKKAIDKDNAKKADAEANLK